MTARRAVTVAVLVAYGWWATSLRPFSTAATVAVVAAGTLAILWGIAHRRACTGPVARHGIGVWLLLACMLTAWQLVAFVQSPRSDHPTLSSMANAVLEPHIMRAFACGAWLLVAARLAAR
jgi:hypothetical protein